MFEHIVRKRAIIPPKLKHGDMVRVVAPADSMNSMTKNDIELVEERLKSVGIKVSYGRHIREKNDFNSASIKSRIEDLHDAFGDREVRGILAADGGFNSNQLLRYIDWDLIRINPKVLCGYSDLTALGNAVFAKTGLVNYSGPLFTSMCQRKHFEYTWDYWQKCLLGNEEIEVKSSADCGDDDWGSNQQKATVHANKGMRVIREGETEGMIIGGNLSSIALLQGTEYMPSLAEAILFLEDDSEFLPHHFDRVFQGLIHLAQFKGVRGIVWGRCDRASKMTDELMDQINLGKEELKGLPIIADADFGHTYPKFTFPIGGRVKLVARRSGIELTITKH